jgi:ferritin-like metal-binding protein YciE
VQPLTSQASAFVRRLRHTSDICIDVRDFESQSGPFLRSNSSHVPLFHDEVFGVSQERRGGPPVNAASAIEHDSMRAGEEARFMFPEQKDPRNGTLYQRRQNHERPVRASIAGHLLRREAARKQLVKALPKMAEKATDKQLKQGFLTHLDETRTHVQRLEQVFQMHGAEVKAVNCPAIDGIIKEADEVAGEVADKAVLDAALINAAQAAEHYEMVRYGSLIAWARQLGRSDCASILQKTLDEEKATDRKLTTLAEGKVNLKAAG